MYPVQRLNGIAPLDLEGDNDEHGMQRIVIVGDPTAGPVTKVPRNAVWSGPHDWANERKVGRYYVAIGRANSSFPE